MSETQPPEAPGFKPKFLSEPATQYGPEEPKPEEPLFYDGHEIHDKKPCFKKKDFSEKAPKEGKPLNARHREIARLHALGKSNNFIADKTHYSASRISILLNSPVIQAEVDRYRDKLFEQDLLVAMKDLGPDAVRTVEEAIRSPDVKIKDRVDAAKWLIEKLTGKAKQEVNVESNTLSAFMEMLKGMQRAGETLEIMDVTPNADGTAQINAPKPNSKFSQWVEDEI